MKAWAGLAVLLVAFSGCLAESSRPCDDCVMEPPAIESVVRPFYLKPGHVLAEEHPASDAPQRVATGDFWVRYETGQPQPTFFSEALNESLVVENATVRFWFTTDGVVPRAGNFAEWDAWFGTDVSMSAVVAMNGPDVVQRGQVYELQAEIGLPSGGFVLEPGERFALMLRPVMLQSQANEIYLLVDAEATPSVLELKVRSRPAGEATLVPITTTFSGTLPAPAYVEAVSGRPPSTLTTGLHPFHVPASAQKVDVVLTGSILLGGKDLDLVVLDAAGEQVAQSVTPYATEHARAHRENLEGKAFGTWTARVNNWLGVGATYTLVVTLWVPEGEAALATGSGA